MLAASFLASPPVVRYTDDEVANTFSLLLEQQLRGELSQGAAMFLAVLFMTFDERTLVRLGVAAAAATDGRQDQLVDRLLSVQQQQAKAGVSAAVVSSLMGSVLEPLRM